MKNKLKKGTRGSATNYITRGKALKKLQLTLTDFRRLCVLKGIYPRDPKKKAEGPLKTYYLAKDIQFLAREPLLDIFRQIRVQKRKIIRAKSRSEPGTLKQLRESMPKYTLDHIVRERYPTFHDALRDLDDPLCMIFLFSSLPALGHISADRVKNCVHLAREFQLYVQQSHSLRKVFASVKGMYYEAEVMGVTVIWLEPHKFAQKLPRDVDYKVMGTFLEFYECLMRFVNFKLFLTLGLSYPPPAAVFSKLRSGTAESGLVADLKQDAGGEMAKKRRSKRDRKSLSVSHESVSAAVQAVMAAAARKEGSQEQVDEEEELAGAQDGGDELDNEDDSKTLLFSGLSFFLGRETPMSVLDFVIRSFGGSVVCETDCRSVGSVQGKITHWVVDRPKLRGEKRVDLEYVQPQWIFDSVNAGILLPVSLYSPGAHLPPHLSPFTKEEEDGYRPAFSEFIERIKAGDTSVLAESAFMLGQAPHVKQGRLELPARREDGHDHEDDAVPAGEGAKDGAGSSRSSAEEEQEEDEKVLDARAAADAKSEEKELAKMMMPRKHQKLYETIMRGRKRRSAKMQTVGAKRRAIDDA